MLKQPIPVYLIVSAGRTDLKVLATDSNGRSELLEVDKNIQRPLHQWMLKHLEGWVVEANKVESRGPHEGKEVRGNAPEKTGQDKSLCKKNMRFDSTQVPPLSYEPGHIQTDNGRLRFVAPKLERIVGTLKELADTHKITFRGALVLYTHRDANHSKAEEEPIALGIALGRWLADTFGLKALPLDSADDMGLALDQVSYYAFLTGNDDLEGKDGGLNPLVRRNLEIVLRRLSNLDPALWAFVATLGGMPDYKSFVTALADLHFQHRWRPVEHSEQAKKEIVHLPHVPYITDAGLMQARANALRLLRNWNIHGALAATVHLPPERGGNWLKVLQCLDGFLAGYGAEPSGDAPFNKALDELVANPLGWKIRKTDRHRTTVQDTAETSFLRLTTAGFRAECSLREGRIAEALNWTYTFYNAMLLDLVEHLARTAFPNGGTQFLNLEDRKLRFVGNKLPYIPSNLVGSDRYDFWFTQNRSGYKFNDSCPLNEPAHAFPMLQTIFADTVSWKHAFQVLEDTPGKFLRNGNTHDVLSPEKIAEIGNTLGQAGLWDGTQGKSAQAMEWNKASVVGTALAQSCLATFYGNGAAFKQRIEAVHAAAVSALLRG